MVFIPSLPEIAMAGRFYFALIVVASAFKGDALLYLKDEIRVKKSNLEPKQLQFPVDNTLHGKSKLGLQPPDFLMRIYKAVAANDGTLKQVKNKMPPTIRCFFGQGRGGQNAFFFNVSGTQRNAFILSAKIRVKLATSGIQGAVPPPLVNIVLHERLYGRPVWASSSRANAVNWVEFPVRTLVRRWINTPSLNQGVYLRLNPQQSKAESPIKLTVDKNNSPMLVVYTDYKPHESETIASWIGALPPRKSRYRVARSSHSHDVGQCAKRNMTVDVRDINWDWVLVPRIFNPLRCGGACSFPLSHSVNPNNHAVIQATVHSVGRHQEVGNPCCVPTKLGGLNMIYQESDGRLVMKYFQGMVVTECGCR